MRNLSPKLRFSYLFIVLLFACSQDFGQLPQCNFLYMDQYAFLGVTTGKIYVYNPGLPPSATNPFLNTIQVPQSPTSITLGLTVSEVLGSGNPTLTFYTVVSNRYWYYNPATSTWVNTGHSAGNTNAYNIAAGGGYIYNLSGADGKVYVYDGTGNGTLLMTVPDFVQEGPYDLIADCEGNFYVLNVIGSNAPPYLRKYSHTGALLHSWTINNPNNYFAGNGSGQTAGFGIIGSTIYVDNTDANGDKFIVSGTLNATTVDFTGPTVPVTNLFPLGVFLGDFGTCANSISATPAITITASATTVPPGGTTPVTFTSAITDGGTNPQYQWYVNGIAVPGATGSTYTYMPQSNDVVTCELTSTFPCITTPTVLSNAIVIDACPPITLEYAALYCQAAGMVSPDFSPAGGSFSVNDASGLQVNTNSGAINLSTARPGAYVITYNTPAAAECPAKTIRDTVIIALTPVAPIILKDKTLCINELVTLSAASGPDYIYKWYPKAYFPLGDSITTVTAKIVAPGAIYLTVTDTTTGCSSTDSLVLNPVTCCAVMLPSAFSPNNDGLNDIFKVNSNTIQQINQFSVYNRYGQRVFYSIDQNEGWDGRYKNGWAESGVYYYYLSYTCSNGEHFVKKGDVTLMR